jgi:predicted small secreted protein
MRRLTLVLAAVALALSACATAHKLGAASDVHALLISIRDNDTAAFDAHVDHEALKAELQSRLSDSLAKNKKTRDLAALLGPSVVDLADQALVRPKTFKFVAEQYGYKADMQIPGPIAISQALKTLPDGRVCATKKKDGPCLLVFTKEDGVWKLTSFEGESSMLRLKL